MEGEHLILAMAEADDRAYVRGHPMWHPLAKDMAIETGTPVFGEHGEF